MRTLTAQQLLGYNGSEAAQQVATAVHNNKFLEHHGELYAFRKLENTDETCKNILYLVLGNTQLPP